MSTIDEIEDAIRNLPEDDLAALRAWFAEFDAQAWDKQFERDVAEGKLDALAEEAFRDPDPQLCSECFSQTAMRRVFTTNDKPERDARCPTSSFPTPPS